MKRTKRKEKNPKFKIKTIVELKLSPKNLAIFRKRLWQNKDKCLTIEKARAGVKRKWPSKINNKL